jgi:pimeloyl-ACP methyl ester carboxylesterase
VRSIAAAADAYRNSGLRARLAKYHADVDGAFWGWNGAWLDPGFRAWNIEDVLPRVQVPALIVQGANDEYGTLAQVDAIERGVRGPVQRLVLENCGHSPQRDQPEQTLAAASEFIRGL